VTLILNSVFLILLYFLILPLLSLKNGFKCPLFFFLILSYFILLCVFFCTTLHKKKLVYMRGSSKFVVLRITDINDKCIKHLCRI